MKIGFIISILCCLFLFAGCISVAPHKKWPQSPTMRAIHGKEVRAIVIDISHAPVFSVKKKVMTDDELAEFSADFDAWLEAQHPRYDHVMTNQLRSNRFATKDSAAIGYEDVRGKISAVIGFAMSDYIILPNMTVFECDNGLTDRLVGFLKSKRITD